MAVDVECVMKHWSLKLQSTCMQYAQYKYILCLSKNVAIEQDDTMTEVGHTPLVCIQTSDSTSTVIHQS